MKASIWGNSACAHQLHLVVCMCTRGGEERLFHNMRKTPIAVRLLHPSIHTPSTPQLIVRYAHSSLIHPANGALVLTIPMQCHTRCFWLYISLILYTLSTSITAKFGQTSIAYQLLAPRSSLFNVVRRNLHSNYSCFEIYKRAHPRKYTCRFTYACWSPQVPQYFSMLSINIKRVVPQQCLHDPYLSRTKGDLTLPNVTPMSNTAERDRLKNRSSFGLSLHTILFHVRPSSCSYVHEYTTFRDNWACNFNISWRSALFFSLSYVEYQTHPDPISFIFGIFIRRLLRLKMSKECMKMPDWLKNYA